jgi:hypothetical protein
MTRKTQIRPAQNDRTIRLPSFKVSIQLQTDGGSVDPGELIAGPGEPELGAAFDALLSMLLSHAVAGIDVEEPRYLEGFETAVISVLNRHNT